MTDGVLDSILADRDRLTARVEELEATVRAAMNELRERNEDMAEWREKLGLDSTMSSATTLGELTEAMCVEPDYRAKHAELLAQLRYALDAYDESDNDYFALDFIDRVRELTGPWPHEKKDAA